MKLRKIIRFLTVSALALVGLVVGVVVLANVLAPAGTNGQPAAAGQAQTTGAVRLVGRPLGEDCNAAPWSDAAASNAASLRTLAWSPFGRAEAGWEIYEPMIAREIHTNCPAGSEGFAKAFAAWETATGSPVDGVVDEAAFQSMRTAMQIRREFVRVTTTGVCPETPDLISAARPEEGYSGKQVWMRPAALKAYRAMVAAARAEVPEIAADPQMLTIFSGYRSPSADAARCAAEGNCDGVVRARCSAHRTGLAADMVVGAAPGFTVDSSADENRLYMTRTPAYRWLLANAGRFGFANYPFEPWHWEWTGESP